MITALGTSSDKVKGLADGADDYITKPFGKGELVAQAPIEELLNGSTSIAYNVTIEGNYAEVHKAVIDQPWVSGIETLERNGHAKWLITVTDEDKAEAELLRLLMSVDGIKVTEFGRNKVDLEDVFMRIVEDANNGK